MDEGSKKAAYHNGLVSLVAQRLAITKWAIDGLAYAINSKSDDAVTRMMAQAGLTEAQADRLMKKYNEWKPKSAEVNALSVASAIYGTEADTLEKLEAEDPKQQYEDRVVTLAILKLGRTLRNIDKQGYSPDIANLDCAAAMHDFFGRADRFLKRWPKQEPERITYYTPAYVALEWKKIRNSPELGSALGRSLKALGAFFGRARLQTEDAASSIGSGPSPSPAIPMTSRPSGKDTPIMRDYSKINTVLLLIIILLLIMAVILPRDGRYQPLPAPGCAECVVDTRTGQLYNAGEPTGPTPSRRR